MDLVLKPLGTRMLLGKPAGILADGIFHLEDVLGRMWAAGKIRSR